MPVEWQTVRVGVVVVHNGIDFAKVSRNFAESKAGELEAFSPDQLVARKDGKTSDKPKEQGALFNDD